MSAKQGWIGEPQPDKTWNRSRASYEADRRATPQATTSQRGGKIRAITPR